MPGWETKLVPEKAFQGP